MRDPAMDSTSCDVKAVPAIGLACLVFCLVAWFNPAVAQSINIKYPVTGPLKTAAEEIEHYAPSLQALHNATVCLGVFPANDTRFRLPDAPLERETYYIQSKGDCVVVLGGTDRAVLFGTYDLLERLGVTWYAPGKTAIVSRSPQLPQIEITSAPAFKRRGVVALGWSEWISTEFVTWAARNRLNTFAAHGYPFKLA